MNGYAVMHNSSLTAQSESGSAVAQRAACAAAVEERGVSRKEGKSAVELALASSVSRTSTTTAPSLCTPCLAL